MYPRNFTAALIAGGKSMRMGRDKAALLIGGRPLWQRQIATLRALAPAQLLVSGPLDGPWAVSGEEIVPDAIADAGPLAGLSAVLERMQSERVLTLAVDLPAMTTEFLISLLEACAPGSGVVPVLDGRFEPLAAVYPHSMREIVDHAVDHRDLSLRSVVRVGLEAGHLEIFPVPESARPLFRNLNTPVDLEDLRVRQ